MKIKVNKNLIIDSLINLQSITNKKSNLIVNTCLLIKAKDSKIYILATDFNISFEGVYNIEIEEEGSITVNSKYFFEIIKDFPVDDIIIESNKDNYIEIKCDKLNFKLINVIDDFPKLPNITKTNFFLNIKSIVLKELIEKITIIEYFDKDDDGKANYLYGVSIEKDSENSIVMTSTDKRRFSIIKYKSDKKIDYEFKKTLLIDKKSLKEAGNFLEANNDIVKIGLCEDKKFVIRKKNEVLVINIIEGSAVKYKYKKYLDDANNIEIKKDDFIMSLRRMSILTSTDKYRYLTFYFKDETLTINSINPYMGESEEKISIKRDKKNEIKVNFNPKNFNEILNKINDDTIILNLADKDYRCFIRGKSDENFLSTFSPITPTNETKEIKK